MTLIKHGIVSVIVTCAAFVACGGSSSSNGNGNGSGAGTGSASAGTSSSAGGSTSTSGGGTAATSGGSTSTSVGGCGTTTMDPGAQMCPAAVTCIETKCKSDLDTCSASTGPCSAYITCANACKCDQTCIDKCTQSATCTACIQTYATCAETSCLDEVLSCVGNGTGGTSSGTGGTFGFGGNAGTFPSFDAGTETCADLNTCCAKLTDAQEKSACLMIVAGKSDAICSLAYSGICSM